MGIKLNKFDRETTDNGAVAWKTCDYKVRCEYAENILNGVWRLPDNGESRAGDE